MRWIVLAMGLGWATLASADRIVFVPTGSKLLLRMMRVEFLTDLTRNRETNRFSLGYGLTKEIEAEFILDRIAPNARLGTMNLSYTYLGPIVDTSPGVSIGVQDVMDRTREGRLYYIAFTYRFGLDGRYNSGVPLELTLGGGFGDRGGLFTGVVIPLTWQFRGFAEHDSRRITAGFEFRPIRGVGLRLMWRDRDPMASVRYVMRF